MTSSISFIPRSVSKKATGNSYKSRVPHKPEGHAPQGNGLSLSTTHQKTIPSAVQTRDTQFEDHELLILIEAALSDYSFWCSPQFQREMKSGQDGCEWRTTPCMSHYDNIAHRYTLEARTDAIHAF